MLRLLFRRDVRRRLRVLHRGWGGGGGDASWKRPRQTKWESSRNVPLRAEVSANTKPQGKFWEFAQQLLFVLYVVVWLGLLWFPGLFRSLVVSVGEIHLVQLSEKERSFQNW